jgi:excisionase family DNA binding protein
MNNPFDVIEARLSNIESLLLNLKQPQQKVEPTDQSEQLLSIQKAAVFLNLSVPTLYSKVSKKELPVCKAPGSKRLYFSKTELLEYIKKGRKKTNEEIKAEACQSLTLKRGAL